MKTQEQIKQDVVNRLVWDSRLDANNIKVKVEDGVVILTGTVPSYTASFSAENVAKEVMDVSKVDNQLKVRIPGSVTLPTDDQIKDNISRFLIHNSNTDKTDIKVSVKDGKVELTGTVDSYWQKIIAEREARSVTGVIKVSNKLAVVPTDDIGDEYIAQRVVKRIDDNTQAKMNKVHVKVKDGQVTLSGNLPSWNQWQSVYNSALYTAGVTNIKDELNIIN